MKIAMIGTGYVGLVSGVCFSDFGHEVVCIDKDPNKIDMLNAGQVPIYEPGLLDVMTRNASRLTSKTHWMVPARSLLQSAPRRAVATGMQT